MSGFDQAGDLHRVSYDDFKSAPASSILAYQLFLVCAVKGAGDDWAAYALPMPDMEPVAPHQVASEGEKVSERDAKQVFFPNITGRYRE